MYRLMHAHLLLACEAPSATVYTDKQRIEAFVRRGMRLVKC